MTTQKRSKIGRIVAVASIILVVVVASIVLYQSIGETVFESERSFSSEKANFEFPLSDDNIEHRIFLITRIHYTDSYQYGLKARLISPSGKEYEKEILDFEHNSDVGSISSTNAQPLFKINSEIGSYRLDLLLKEEQGSVTIKTVKITVKKL